MTLPASGQLALSDIAGEFGGGHPIAMSSYYRGGAHVGSSETSIPESGAISISEFYGASAESALSISSSGGSAQSDGFGTFTANPECTVVNTPAGGSGSYASFENEYVSGDTSIACVDASQQSPQFHVPGGFIVGSLETINKIATWKVTVQDSEGHTASTTYTVELDGISVND